MANDEMKSLSENDAEFEAALEQNLDVITPEKGQSIKGKIVSKGPENTIVDCGAKSEAVIPTNEVGDHEEGDEIEATVAEAEPELLLTRKVNEENKEDIRFRNAFDSRTPIEGKIVSECKGGFNVYFGETRAFLPISHLDTSFVKDTSPFIGNTYEFEVIEYSDGGKQFVVSRANLVQKEQAKLAEKTWKNIEVGSIMEGTVRSIQNFGAFVDLGGVEGLLHISELSKDYTTHPSDLLKIGDDISVKILSADQSKNRISLSMKDLAPDPWENYSDKLIVGDKFTGTIVRKAEFGLFVQLFPGIDGLLHISQLRPGSDIEDDQYAIGTKIDCWVRNVDIANKRVGLTLREMPSEDPWQKLNDTYQEGALFDGIVEECTQYGVFVELEPGLTGLMPLSELKKVGFKNIPGEFPPRSSVRVKITAIDTVRQRISLMPENLPTITEPAEKKSSRPEKPKNREQPRQDGNDGNGVTEFGAMLAAALKDKDSDED